MRPHNRKGNIAVLAVVSMAVLLGFGAIVVDLSWRSNSQMELQDAVDAAAHAATAQLDGTAAGLAEATRIGALVGNRNQVRGEPLRLGSTAPGGDIWTISLGRWSNGTFTIDTSNPSTVTAARVAYVRSGLRTVFAGAAFGRPTLEIKSAAIAQGGGSGEADCVLPIAVPDCGLAKLSDVCLGSITLNADSNDTGAWALAGSSRPNANSVSSAIRSCGSATVGGVVTLNNGTINSALSTLASAVSASPHLWPTSKWGALPTKGANSGVNPYGHVLNGTVYVFHDPASCRGTKFNGTSLTLVGFASVGIYDVATKGAVAKRQIKLRTDCTVQEGAGGGGFYGVTVPPSLVQ